jgi:hypothetical protein
MFAAIAVRLFQVPKSQSTDLIASFIDGPCVRTTSSLLASLGLASPWPVKIYRNKWVLDKTSIPVFFLEVQLLIAVVMLAFSKWLGFFDISLTLERDTCKALIPMIAINVLGLK